MDAGFTSLGSWGPVKETVPYFTCVGIVPDYYPFWWPRTGGIPCRAATQAIVKEVAQQACAKQADMQYDSDMDALKKYGTKDPQKIGVYVLEGKELDPYKKLWMEEVEKEHHQSHRQQGQRGA